MFLAAAVAASPAQTFTSLFSFSQPNYTNPLGGLVQGLDGNLWGTTTGGGANSNGTVFKITPSGTVTTIYSFCAQSSCTDGSYPVGTLLLGSNGNFYGVTATGGTSNDGTVFEITPAGKLTTLHSFSGTDGASPGAGVIQATNGNFYGTTSVGGIGSQGTIYQITAAGKFTSLYSFCQTTCSDGANPVAPLIQATNGNLYGTAHAGGGSDCQPNVGGGTFFQVTLAGKVTILHAFCEPNGFYPSGAMVQASNGNFYGTTEAGGDGTNTGSGTLYEITSAGKLTSLYSFCLQSGCSDGNIPTGLVLGPDGNFYGTTQYGGASNNGSIFEITPQSQLTTLHSFDDTDGSDPAVPMVLATNGIFYGTTFSGGVSYGTVFSVANGFSPFVQAVTSTGKVGAKITILGMGLSGTTAVSFNGTSATFTATSSKITATVPAGATTGLITVTTPSGTLTNKASFLVTPQLINFTPGSGTAGTAVTITGVSLTQTSKVTFNGTSAAFTVNSDTQVTATVPTDAITGKIKITTPGGSATSTASFTVN